MSIISENRRPSKITAHAEVTLKVTLAVGDAWGGDCSLDQIHKQAVDSAIDEIRQAPAFKQYTTADVKPEHVRIFITTEERR